MEGPIAEIWMHQNCSFSYTLIPYRKINKDILDQIRQNANLNSTNKYLKNNFISELETKKSLYNRYKESLKKQLETFKQPAKS